MITLRPWVVKDAEFCLSVRNHPDLMKWFRQEVPLKLAEQRKFIETAHDYNGRVIMNDTTPVGLCSVKKSGEFTIGVLPQYQGKGYSLKAMKLLLKGQTGVWSEVFVGNPALEFFVSKCGFRITGVKERAYYKQGKGLVDVVTIRHDKPNRR